MNIKEIIDKACIIGDISKEDYSYSHFVMLIDQAQQIIANLCLPVINVFSIKNNDDGVLKYTMPVDFKELYSIRRHLSTTPVKYEMVGNRLIIDDKGDFDVFYIKVPTHIDESTSELYEPEVEKSAHFAIPYYIVYQICKSYDTTTAQSALTEWNKYVSLCKRKPGFVVKEIINNY